jgi:hypothetical protein
MKQKESKEGKQAYVLNVGLQAILSKIAGSDGNQQRSRRKRERSQRRKQNLRIQNREKNEVDYCCT